MPGRGDRSPITLECTECATRGYATSKNRRNNPDRLELSRYCRKCRKHTQHRETR